MIFACVFISFNYTGNKIKGDVLLNTAQNGLIKIFNLKEQTNTF